MLAHSHTHAYGRAGQLEVGYLMLTVMVEGILAIGFELQPV